MQITLVKHILPPDSHHRYLENDNGQLDIIGQVLTQLGHNCEGKHRIPSDLCKIIPHFTTLLRTRIVDTPLTHSLINLDIYPPPERLARAVEILSQYFQVQVKL